MLRADETRLLRRVTVEQIRGELRQSFPAEVVAFVGEDDTICSSIEVDVSAEWHVAIINDGNAFAHWRGANEDAPGWDVWMEIGQEGRLEATVEGILHGTHVNPTERDMKAILFTSDGVIGWDLCLAPLNADLGHLVAPYIAPPSLESL